MQNILYSVSDHLRTLKVAQEVRMSRTNGPMHFAHLLPLVTKPLYDCSQALRALHHGRESQTEKQAPSDVSRAATSTQKDRPCVQRADHVL